MSEHDSSWLGAYALGALEPDEARTAAEHLSQCAACREELADFEELKDYLGEVPAEAFLDGPPPAGDLLLQRTLREVRDQAQTAAVSDLPEVRPGASAGAQPSETVETPSESVGAHVATVSRPARVRLLAAAAAVVLVGSALGGGVLIGRQTAGHDVAVPAVTTPAGTRHVTATDASSGATMAAAVQPRNGWTWVDVRLSGLPAGTECILRVTSTSGKVYVAGSWVVSARAVKEGPKFSGGVLLPLEQVRSVDLVTTTGRPLVSTPL